MLSLVSQGFFLSLEQFHGCDSGCDRFGHILATLLGTLGFGITLLDTADLLNRTFSFLAGTS